jgi:hypothetical protein
MARTPGQLEADRAVVRVCPVCCATCGVCACALQYISRGQMRKRATPAQEGHPCRPLPRPGDHLAALWATCLACATLLCLGLGPVVRSTL